MASLIALATIRPGSIHQRGDRVMIPMARLCTERTPLTSSGTILAAWSRLTVRPVSSIEWTLDGNFEEFPQAAQIDGLFLESDFWDKRVETCSLVVFGDLWRCRLLLTAKSFSLVLADQSEPRPASELLPEA
jgi:hypothetical protein